MIYNQFDAISCSQDHQLLYLLYHHGKDLAGGGLSFACIHVFSTLMARNIWNISNCGPNENVLFHRRS